MVNRGWRWLLRRVLPRRLDHQLILLVTLVLSLAVPYFALHEAQESAARVVSSATLQARALAENIAVTSVAHIITHDFASSEQLLLRAARFPSVMEAQVVDVDGKIITDVITTPDGNPRLRYELTQLKIPDKPTLEMAGEGLLFIWEPVVGASQVGWVRLVYSLAEAETISQDYFRDYMVDGVMMAFILMVAILLVMRRPLYMLREAATFAAELKNKRGGYIPVDSRAIEVEQLGLALNEAATNLFEQEVMIKRVLKALNTQKLALDEHTIVSITDVDGNITYANKKFLDATGFSSEELLGRKHDIINSGFHDKEYFRDMWNTISAGDVWHGEILNRSKSGRELWVNTTIVPFMDEVGKTYEYVGIRTDVTEMKMVERELEDKARSLKQMSDHLEELVKQRTSELEEANRQLQYLSNMKSELVSVVSHELRTPLTSIKSFAGILRDDIEQIDIDTQKHYLSIINEESDRLGRLINDLLDLQKMDSGKAHWKDKQIDLVEVLEKSVEFFESLYRDKKLGLQLSVGQKPCLVCLDADRIRQLVDNLLSNALKFTEEGQVVVEMATTASEVKMTVTDSGIGIPADEIEKVFESFHQVDSSDIRKTRGSGLGLAICREIVKHYQGRIWVDSTLGVGSRFNIVLPLLNGTKSLK